MPDAALDFLKKLSLRPGFWEGGAWTPGGGERLAVTNPATGAAITDVPLASEAEFTRAIDGASAAFGVWRREPAAARGEVLKRAAALIVGRRSDLAEILTREQGKPLSQALAEVEYAASFFQWFGEEARRLGGRLQSHPQKGREYRIRSEPAGVAGLVTPWNFPLAQGAKKVSAALAAGCSVVWKPSELTPLVALALGPILKEAGLPDGALQILPARGPVAGTALTGDERVRVLSLTGSTNTGRTLMQAAAKHLQRVSLELGGNAPFLILPDADLDTVAADLVTLKLLCAGQVCVTANRVFVPENLEQQLIQKLGRLWTAFRVGDGLEEGVAVGPLIHKQACERVGGLVHQALAEGAELVAENHSHARDARLANGSFFSPTILRGVRGSMAIAREEVFGPVLSLLAYSDLTDAVRRANATPYGLAGYVYGTNLTVANAVAEELDVGIVGVNEWRPLRAEVPFGGVKYSGMGREGGEEGIREFCDVKVIASPRVSAGRP